MRPLGLALGGGGASFFSHLGVLQVLEDNGIEISALSASSISGSIAVLTSLSIPVKKQYKHFESMTRGGLVLKPIMERRGWKQFRSYIGDHTLETLPIPVRLASVDIMSGKEYFISKGNIENGIKASMAHPFVYNPVYYQDKFLIDGGTTNNIPADAVRTLVGRDGVVLASTLGMGAHSKPSVYRNPLTRTLRTVFIALERLREEVLKEHADIIVRPLEHIPMSGTNYYKHIFSFGSSKKNKMHYQFGVNVMEQKLPELLKKIK